MAAGSSAAPAAGAIAVSLADVSVTFRLADGGAYTAVESCDARRRGRRIRRDRRADRLRQVDAAQRRGRPDRALDTGSATIFGEDLPGPQPAGRLPVPGRGAVSRGRPRSRTSRSGWRSPARAKAEARARAEKWLTRVGLAGFGDRYPHMLSGGQRKRVGLDAGADPRSEDPADGRAVRPARRADAADHGQSAARPVERATARRCCSSRTTSKRRSRCPTAW